MLESLFLLLPISIFFVLLIGAALWWAIFSGQFDDLDAAGKSILMDDDHTDTAQLSNKEGERREKATLAEQQTQPNNKVEVKEKADK